MVDIRDLSDQHIAQRVREMYSNKDKLHILTRASWINVESLITDKCFDMSDDQKAKTLVEQLRDLQSDELRREVISEFCNVCGSTDPSCHCWNDG